MAMIGYHTRRAHQYSVHMTPDVAVDLVNELNLAAELAYRSGTELPTLERLQAKVNKLIGSKEGTRA